MTFQKKCILASSNKFLAAVLNKTQFAMKRYEDEIEKVKKEFQLNKTSVVSR